MSWKWGKAGQRLTESQKQQRRHRIMRRKQMDRDMLTEARRRWEEQHILPCRITMALDLKGLHGPDVDKQCGTEEPAVDMWEAGTRYPTWEQYLALAELTHQPLAFFWQPIEPEDMGPVFVCRRSEVGSSCKALHPQSQVTTWNIQPYQTSLFEPSTQS